MKQTDGQRHGLEVLAIIPARGGSKGLPRKNILDLCGKPLIGYSIEAALRAQCIGRVVVSTDDPEIADIARCFGAEIPFLRPGCMAGDKSSVGLAITHTLSSLRNQGYAPDAYVTLYPTSPFRTPSLLDYLCTQLSNGFNSVITVRRMDHDSRALMTRHNGALLPLLPHQEFNCSFERRYGLFQGTRFHAPDKYFVHFIRNQASLLDIDTLEDFYLAEEIIRSGYFRFNE